LIKSLQWLLHLLAPIIDLQFDPKQGEEQETHPPPFHGEYGVEKLGVRIRIKITKYWL
jgi:hypothetical protein